MALVLLSMGLAYQASESTGLAQLDDVAYRQLDLYASSLENELDKYAHLPSLIEMNKSVGLLFANTQPQDAQKQANRALSNLNVRVGAKTLFLVGADGSLLASSDGYGNIRATASHVSAMPFFVQAMAQNKTQFFAASGDKGASEYYFVQPYVMNQKVLGVMGVQISLGPLEATWVDLGARSEREELLVVDAQGVVIMSSVPRWKYRSLSALSAGQTQALEDLGTYPRGAVAPLGLSVQSVLARGVKQVSLPGAADAPALLRVMQERPVPQLGWRLVILSDPQPVWQTARNAAWGGGALTAFVCLLGLYLLQRQRAMQQLFVARNALQQANSQLENVVAQRTQELSQTNQQLVAEIQERVLAQDELVQAGKLAVLGQMSAGVAHEINQPLTALRALSTNTVLLLNSGRTAEVRDNLQAIGEVTTRMQGITTQLKSFARKGHQLVAAVSVPSAIEQVKLLLAHRSHSQPVHWVLDLAHDLPAVRCDANRLVQVLLNLCTNALDAMAQEPVQQLALRAQVHQGRVQLSVADTGPAVTDAVMQRLFEPFFSTKPAGQGLGLGLVISSHIVREFGSELRVQHGKPQGLVFLFDLAIDKDVTDV
jgi:two-component system, NtrC family, C4-dicarboxylate transport sensor histidine kinase DctB